MHHTVDKVIDTLLQVIGSTTQKFVRAGWLFNLCPPPPHMGFQSRIVLLCAMMQQLFLALHGVIPPSSTRLAISLLLILYTYPFHADAIKHSRKESIITHRSIQENTSVTRHKCWLLYKVANFPNPGVGFTKTFQVVMFLIKYCLKAIACC